MVGRCCLRRARHAALRLCRRPAAAAAHLPSRQCRLHLNSSSSAALWLLVVRMCSTWLYHRPALPSVFVGASCLALMSPLVCCHADPRVAAQMARAFVTGLQGGDGTGTYIKASATCKHFVGNDMENWHGGAGPEGLPSATGWACSAGGWSCKLGSIPAGREGLQAAETAQRMAAASCAALCPSLIAFLPPSGFTRYNFDAKLDP